LGESSELKTKTTRRRQNPMKDHYSYISEGIVQGDKKKQVSRISKNLIYMDSIETGSNSIKPILSIEPQE